MEINDLNMSVGGIRVSMKGNMANISKVKEHLEDRYRVVGYKVFRVHKVKEDGGWDEKKLPSDVFKVNFILYVNGGSLV